MYRDDFPEQNYHQERQGPGERIAELESKLEQAQAENERYKTVLESIAEEEDTLGWVYAARMAKAAIEGQSDEHV